MSIVRRVDPSDGKSGASPAGMGVRPADPGSAYSDEFRRRVAERAYELAQRRSFAPGHELDDWLQAEREIEAGPVRDTPPPDKPLAGTH